MAASGSGSVVKAWRIVGKKVRLISVMVVIMLVIVIERGWNSQSSQNPCIVRLSTVESAKFCWQIL